MAIATVTSKGRITIPAKVRSALNLAGGDRVEFVKLRKGLFGIVPITPSVRELCGLFRHKARKPVSIAEMNADIAWGASRPTLPRSRG